MKSLSVVEQIRRDKARAERLRELQREAKQAEAKRVRCSRCGCAGGRCAIVIGDSGERLGRSGETPAFMAEHYLMIGVCVGAGRFGLKVCSACEAA